MSNTYSVNGEKATFQRFVEFRLTAIEKKQDELSSQISKLQNWQSKDEGKGSGSSITVMYLFMGINLLLTGFAIFKSFN